jgi:hypothetical protein
MIMGEEIIDDGRDYMPVVSKGFVRDVPVLDGSQIQDIRTTFRQHGLTEALLGFSVLYLGTPYKQVLHDFIYSVQETAHSFALTDYLNVAGIAALYVMAEGTIDALTGSNKHQLTTSLLRYLGFKKTAHNISIPGVSELESAVEKYHELDKTPI